MLLSGGIPMCCKGSPRLARSGPRYPPTHGGTGRVVRAEIDSRHGGAWEGRRCPAPPGSRSVRQQPSPAHNAAHGTGSQPTRPRPNRERRYSAGAQGSWRGSRLFRERPRKPASSATGFGCHTGFPDPGSFPHRRRESSGCRRTRGCRTSRAAGASPRRRGCRPGQLRAVGPRHRSRASTRRRLLASPSGERVEPGVRLRTRPAEGAGPIRGDRRGVACQSTTGTEPDGDSWSHSRLFG
jgi:hypothetical protein